MWSCECYNWWHAVADNAIKIYSYTKGPGIRIIRLLELMNERRALVWAAHVPKISCRKSVFMTMEFRRPDRGDEQSSGRDSKIHFILNL